MRHPILMSTFLMLVGFLLLYLKFKAWKKMEESPAKSFTKYEMICWFAIYAILLLIVLGKLELALRLAPRYFLPLTIAALLLVALYFRSRRKRTIKK